MKNVSIFFILIFLASCSTVEVNNLGIDDNNSWEIVITDSDLSVSWFKERSVELNIKDKETVKINLDSENTNIDNDWIQISGQKITIKKSWNYEFSWVLSDWQIIVETEDEKDVQIILNNVEISNSSSSTIIVNNANQTIINLADDSINTLVDAKIYSSDNEDAINANIFSKDDLVINWNWILNVIWNYSDWITSKDKLFIDGWNITVTSVGNWIRWKDYILINSWNIKIESEWDSLKSDNEDKWTILINGWDIEISSWDDWINAEQYFVINDWTLNVIKSYEALESKEIVFNWWDIYLTSSDDWINVTSGETSGWGEKAEDIYLKINGWNLTLNSNWDGLDSNGSIIMTWWNVIVYWPTENNNWSLDFNWVFNISGWELISVWSSWMAEAPSETSTQNSVLIWLENSYDSWSNISFKDELWEEIFTLIPIKAFQSIVISSQDLLIGSKYTLEIDWEQIEEFTISDVITTIWTVWSWWKCRK